MKIPEFFCLALAILLSSQNNLAQKKGKPEKYYEKGVEAYKNNDFKAADSLFTIFHSLVPEPEILYYQALTKLRLGDSCGYCNYYFKSLLIDSLNTDPSSGICEIWDTVVYPGESNTVKTSYAIVHRKRCQDEKVVNFYFKYHSTGEITMFYIPDPGSEYLKDENIGLLFPKFKEIPPQNIKVYKGNEIPVFTDNEEPCQEADVMPEFQGGENKRIEFLAKAMKYPQEAKDKGIQGKIYVGFIVEKDGSVTNVKILKGLEKSLDEEAIRVVKLMPKWKPGMQNGRPVRVQFNMPLVFQISKVEYQKIRMR